MSDISDVSPFLDRYREVETTTRGYLPHLHQDGTLQSVVFRLSDSLPQSLLKELQRLKEDFIRLHPLPWDDSTSRTYTNNFSANIERYLNNGMGACLLRRPEVRALLEEEIFRRDGIEYHIEAFVIMPNHVHLLFLPLQDNKSSDIISGIKHRSALRINRLMGRRGRLWVKESYDRLIRDENHYKYIINYIEQNPAGLPSSHYSLYRFRYCL